MLWNLVGHGIKLTARGIEAFSRTDAGKKTGQVTAEAYRAAKERSKSAIEAYRHSRTTHRASGGWQEGTAVVTGDGRVGLVVRYLFAHEFGGSTGTTTATPLVLIDLVQFSSELDRYLIIHENSIRAL